MEQVNESLMQVFDLVNEMSPYLLLGFLFAGIMHVFIPKAVYSRYLSGHGFRSVLYSTLMGIPLPLCSCGVIPTAMSLRKEGASKGATVSFLVATPETGVDSIIATYSLMGLPFAVVRPVVAFVTSLFAGQMVNVFDKDDAAVEPVKEEEKHSCCCCHDDDDDDDGDECHCHEHEHNHCHEHEHDHCHSHEPAHGFMGKLRSAFEYAFVEMMEDIGKWLVVGLLVAGLITVFVPDAFFEIFKGNTLLSMLLVLCIAIPMYICATGSIPIAVALIMKGLTPGAALVLLMAGPACNMASILLIKQKLGMRTLLVYLFSIITGAVVAGIIIDQLPMEWFMPTLMNTASCHEHSMEWFNILCTIVLAVLLLNAFWQKKKHPHCCC